MKRVLISQNERNNGTDYLIVDGSLIQDEDKVVHYGRIFSKTDKWKEVFNDDFLEIRQQDKQLLIKSFYNDKDVVGRVIYYMYLIDDTDDIETILNYLEKDSQVINRTFDRERVHEIIERINANDRLKKVLSSMFQLHWEYWLSSIC
ncbi:hypothetical protein QNH98_02180 [Myroides sp. mNGS23_01]|nr:hypothetical protein [Myroides sp. mNGS23_01]WHT39530.1 hypothetical protein QNH98_02180 [Myroides sp. mNGS23_01]